MAAEARPFTHDGSGLDDVAADEVAGLDDVEVECLDGVDDDDRFAADLLPRDEAPIVDVMTSLTVIVVGSAVTTGAVWSRISTRSKPWQAPGLPSKAEQSRDINTYSVL
ncbi:hypothetical protein LTR85_001543 [Meristemomyces frigidus]|nr:hypothetical protein LTR85_001543 [Meristemomyces frigidus]